MSTVRFADPAHFRQAIGLLAEHGLFVASYYPDILIVGRREIEFLRREDLLDEETLARFGLQRTRDKELVALFLSRYDQQQFSHSDKLLPHLRRGGTKVVLGPGMQHEESCSHYASIYEQRAKTLEAAGYDAEQYESFRGLAQRLEATPSEPCCLWELEPPGLFFAVFEVSGTIAGCLEGVKTHDSLPV